MERIRLNKYISSSGYCSRRAADRLIVDGKVMVNGVLCITPGCCVSEKDTIEINGETVVPTKQYLYLMINKPIGYMSSLNDPHHDKFVTDLVKGYPNRIYPVGRLDLDSHGMLILTDDGDLTYRLTHPKHIVEKEYLVKIDSSINDEEIRRLEAGVVLDGRITARAIVRRSDRSTNILHVVIHEGRNRQVRRMFESIGHRVTDLKRIRIGKLELGDLEPGRYRELNKNEIMLLEE